MMNKFTQAKIEARKITNILNIVFHGNYFPVDVAAVAQDYSKEKYPDDYIHKVGSDNLGEFEGALFHSPKHPNRWYIIYNNAITNEGRQRFTLAHELGHYLLHRHLLASNDEFMCGSVEMMRENKRYDHRETEANVFASHLLMPTHDFRKQVHNQSITFYFFGELAEHYGVSIIAAILRWLEFIPYPALVVASRDGYMLWASASKEAYQHGYSFATKQAKNPIAVPEQSFAYEQINSAEAREGIRHPKGVWFNDVEVFEMGFASEDYDQCISLLLLDEIDHGYEYEEEVINDASDHFHQWD